MLLCKYYFNKTKLNLYNDAQNYYYIHLQSNFIVGNANAFNPLRVLGTACPAARPRDPKVKIQGYRVDYVLLKFIYFYDILLNILERITTFFQ